MPTRDLLMPGGARRLQQSLGLFILFRLFTEAPDADLYWGADGLVPELASRHNLWLFDVNMAVVGSLVVLAGMALLLLLV